MIQIVPARIKHISIFGQSTGEISETVIQNANGLHATAWEFSNGATPFSDMSAGAKSNLSAGQYRFSATDATRDKVSINYIVNQNRKLQIYPGTVEDVDVYGENTGSVGRTSISGGNGTYTPYWSSNTSLDMSDDHSLLPKQNLYAGDYTVEILDGVGATATYTYTVNQTQQLRIHAGKTSNATLNGLRGGFISKTIVTGGRPPYYFHFTSSIGGSEIPEQIKVDEYDVHTVSEKLDLKPAEYLLTVSDSLGAVARTLFTIREGPERQYYKYGGTRNFVTDHD